MVTSLIFAGLIFLIPSVKKSEIPLPFDGEILYFPPPLTGGGVGAGAGVISGCISAYCFPLPSIPSRRGGGKFFTFCESAKTAAMGYLQSRTDSEHQETPPIMNGGHYMTRGHVIAYLLYIKKRLMSRNILEPGENRFGPANGPVLNDGFAPSAPA
jgi:hypothetical protein